MDTYVTDGDFYLNTTGHPIGIHSIEEACQRVRFSLLTEKGSFAFDRQLGADYDYIFFESDPDFRLFVMDAVSDQKDISIGEVTAERDGNYIVITAQVFYGDESMNTEVRINGNIRADT